MPADLPTLQRSPMPRQRLSSTGVTEYWIETAASFRLDVSGPDHLGPLLGFLGNERPEIARRATENNAAEVGELSLQLGIGEAGIDLLVEFIDDLIGRVLCLLYTSPSPRD